MTETDENTTHFGYKTVETGDKAGLVRGVFDSVASRYDIMNDLMSAGLHRLWKRYTIDQAAAKSGQSILDLAGGTGDLAREFSKKVGKDGHVGVSLTHHAQTHAVRRALAMMASGEASLGAVAAAADFYDQSHMTRTFRRILARTPAECQRLFRNTAGWLKAYKTATCNRPYLVPHKVTRGGKTMIAILGKTTMRMALAIVVLTTAACVSSRNAPAPLTFAGELDARIVESLDRLETVQGLSVAVYTPDGVYTQGFGAADMETGERVTEDTAFYIASSTKSFLALAMSLLDARGEIDLEDSIAEFAPDAAFPPSVNVTDVTLRDLLTHTSGIETTRSLSGWRSQASHDPETLWRLLGDSEPNQDAPHGAFDYTNVGYNILTVLTDRKTANALAGFVAAGNFRQAKMTRTSAYMSDAGRGGWSLARPHETLGPGAPYRILLEKTDATMQSAGGMIMSAADAVTWLSVMVNDGRLDGEQVFPAAAIQATRAPLAEAGGAFGGYTREHYGLGWYLGAYRGERMAHHFGGFPAPARTFLICRRARPGLRFLSMTAAQDLNCRTSSPTTSMTASSIKAMRKSVSKPLWAG